MRELWAAVLFPLLMLVGLGWLLFRLLKPAPGKVRACTTCEHVGPSRKAARGSTALEGALWLVCAASALLHPLWLLTIWPALGYSIWRATTKRHVCASCGAATLVPVDSPAGRRIKGAQRLA